MEWTIPIQTIDTSKILIGQIYNNHKPMSPLSYIDGDLRFPSVNILLPMTSIQSYETATGKLALLLPAGEQASTKISNLQEMLLSSVYSKQTQLFKGCPTRTTDELRSGFQMILDGNVLKLYCPIGTTAPQGVHDLPIYTGGKWVRGLKAGMLTEGKSVRLALRIQGISFHLNPVTQLWTGKFRLQHRITAILID
jgi:hypothetical protein